MPALRDRMEDLPELARFFLRRYNIKFRKNVQGIAESTLDILSSYWWPGNIRELENLIERLVAVSDKDWITDEDLPYELRGETRYAGSGGDGICSSGRSLDLRAQLHRARAQSSWNVTATSRALGIPLSTLKFKMDKLEIRSSHAGSEQLNPVRGENQPGAFERRRVRGEWKRLPPLRGPTSWAERRP